MKTLTYSLVVSILFVLASCTKQDASEQFVKKEAFFTLKRSILIADEGHMITDKNGKLLDGSGITVTVENTNPVINTITNSKGEFRLSIDTTIKSFALVYSKALYGTFKEYYAISNDSLYQLQYAWDDNIPPTKRNVNWEYGQSITFSRKSTVTVNSLQASIVNRQLKLTCNISTPNTEGETYVRLFYQKNLPFISFSNVLKTEKTMSGPILVHNGDNVLDFCATCCLYGYSGMNSGDTVYMTAYGDSFGDNIYKDISTNQLVMPNINLSNHITPISFVLP